MTQSQVETNEAAEEATENMDAEPSRQERVEKIAKNHILSSMGVGMLPLPFVDMAAMTGIQLNMLRKIALEYDVPFKQDAGKSVISSLLGGVLPVSIGCTVASLVKFIPLIGQTAGAMTMPALSGASTYAIYKVFVQHFESGGTFLDLDPKKVKNYFAEQFKRGKKQAQNMKAEAEAEA